MPLTEKGKEIEANMKKEYGPKKGESVFYASANKGTIKGVHGDVSTQLKTSLPPTSEPTPNKPTSEMPSQVFDASPIGKEMSLGEIKSGASKFPMGKK